MTQSSIFATPIGEINHSVFRHAVAVLCLAVSLAIGPVVHKARGQDPSGTRPTVIRNLKIASGGPTYDVVTGNLTTVSGHGVGSMTVEVYAVFPSAFLRVGRGRTGANGFFSVEVNKNRGRDLQCVITGNGAYSRPYPTIKQP